MRLHVASTERSAAFRSRSLSFAKTCSMGFRSGLQGGKNHSRAPAARIMARTAAPLWLPGLSKTTMSPGLRVGTSTCST